MSLRLVVLQHERGTGLGTFATLLDRARVDYQIVETLRGRLPDHVVFDGAIALGGSLNAHDPRLLETRRWIRNGVFSGLPFLGICLGGQLLASALGAVVERGRPEAGLHDVFLTDAADHDPLFAGLPRRLQVFGWHEDSFELAQGAVPLAGSMACTYQAFRFGAAAYGLQFHAEVGAGDVARWREVPGYNGLAKRTGTDFDALMIDLRRATPHLGALAAQLLHRWLHLVASRREAAA
jgi:GMP synthase (glutamine-hydrolysing)